MADINVRMPSEDEEYDATTVVAGSAPNPTPDVSAETPDFSKPAETVAPAAAAAPVAPVAPAVEEAAPAPVEQAVVVDKAPKGPKKPLPVWPIVTGVLALAVIGLLIRDFSLMGANKDLQTQLDKANANPQLLVQKQTDDLIAKVGSLMTLPTGETPTVANVSDAEKAKQQSAFFAKAENGDRVLMYVKAGQAILYRPSTNKIILVAPLTFNNDATTGTASTTTKK